MVVVVAAVIVVLVLWLMGGKPMLDRGGTIEIYYHLQQ
jgi:uncharacterized membrane protein YdbT with pleckstrin-like domain